MSKARPGTKAKHLTRRTINTFVDTGEAFKRTLHSALVEEKRFDPQADIILVENGSGADRDRFDILGIEQPIISPTDNLDEFHRQVAIKGITPNSAYHFGNFVILLEPLAAGSIGRGCVSGVCPVRLNVTDAAEDDYEFADVKDDDATQLQSAKVGSGRILYRESGTGTKWAVVRLSNAPATDALVIRGQLTGDLATTDSTFEIDGVVVMQPVGGTIAEGNVTIYNVFNWEGDEDGECMAIWNQDNEHWEAVQVECPA